jgi:hypothetical protein
MIDIFFEFRDECCNSKLRFGNKYNQVVRNALYSMELIP